MAFMVNMNQYKDPCIYALTGEAGVFIYVGRTKTNALNRWWEHRYRARINHPAPVYQEMNRRGPDSIGWEVLQFLRDDDDAKAIESSWIKRLIEEGHPLVNALGRDGTPDSIPVEMRETMNRDKRGKPSWTSGKKGEAAGWTEERREAQRQRLARIRAEGKLGQ